MNRTVADTEVENNALRKEFERRGLDLGQVWHSCPGDPELDNRRLRELFEWVVAYESCPDRGKLEQRGYFYPPVEPDIDPDADWIRFERWVQHKPVTWRYADAFGQLKPADHLTEAELSAMLDTICEQLARRGIVIEACSDDVPERLWYEYLYRKLGEEEFEFVESGALVFMTGCDGYCPDCVQRPWCANGSSSCWPEDEEAGHMVVADRARRFVSASPVSLDVLRAADEEAAGVIED
jgi:hypothetical protein